jgi:hypothetical protein
MPWPFFLRSLRRASKRVSRPLISTEQNPRLRKALQVSPTVVMVAVESKLVMVWGTVACGRNSAAKVHADFENSSNSD